MATNNSCNFDDPVAVANGGTASANASDARTALGLAIGSDVQAHDADLDAIAALAKTNSNFIVGNGSTWVLEDASTSRTSLGLGTIATQASNSVDIDGGAVDGITLGTNSAVTEAQIDNVNVNGNTIVSSDTNGNLNLTPDGTGDLVLDGLKWPQADGTPNYVLKTDGSNQLSWTENTGGGGGGADLRVGYNNDQLAASDYHTLAQGIYTSDTTLSILDEDDLYCHPFYIGAAVTASDVGIYVFGGVADQRIRFAVFKDNSGELGDIIFESGEQTCDAAGYKWYSSSTAFLAGPHWLCYVIKTASNVSLVSCSVAIGGGWTGDNATLNGNIRFPYSYGEIIDATVFSGETMTATAGSQPIIYIQV